MDTLSTPSTTTALSQTAPASPTTESIVELRGRLAVASFPNNIDNIDPANYVWVKNFSNYILCHKTSGPTSEPRQSLFWIVGDVDSLNLETTRPYGSWTVGIRLPPATNRALNALLETGCTPYRTGTLLSA